MEPFVSHVCQGFIGEQETCALLLCVCVVGEGGSPLPSIERWKEWRAFGAGYTSQTESECAFLEVLWSPQ